MDPLSGVAVLKQNSRDVFLETARILLKFANNILNDPSNPRYRKIRISNPTVMEKLLPVDGAMDCLFAMGFEEDENGDFLHFPQGASIVQLNKIRDEIDREHSSASKDTDGSQVKDTPASLPPEGAANRIEYPAHVASPAAGGPIVYPPHTPLPPTAPPVVNPIQLFAQEVNFHQRIYSEFQRVLIYEDPRLQQRALQCIPMEELKKSAEECLRHINEASCGEDCEGAIDVHDCFIIELARWFRTQFFSWVDQPKCQRCNGPTRGVGSVEPTAEDKRWGAGRVENYLCDSCGIHTRFPRYNHPGKLLETRRGRCGEWANCFTLLCRACGYEARHVIDWTDHVWTEVYSLSQQRWVHSDTGEGGYDKPLLYEAGWGKKLTYVIAFSKDDIQDVTWRYSANHKDVLSRRTEVRELWLVESLLKLRRERQASLPEPRRAELLKRTINELVEMMSERSEVKEGEMIGRQTGSLAWRVARGEAGARAAASASTSYVFRLTPEEQSQRALHVKYCCASDKYVRVSTRGQETTGWNGHVFEADNVFRKVEDDWKMAYLARNERTNTAKISWKFDFTDTNLSVDQLEVRASSQTFESGQVSWRLCSEDNCMVLHGGAISTNCEAMRGARTLTLTAQLSQGTGDNAWQHTQLFRQGLDEVDTFPLEIKVTLI